jgi:hypothetical protein
MHISQYDADVDADVDATWLVCRCLLQSEIRDVVSIQFWSFCWSGPSRSPVSCPTRVVELPELRRTLEAEAKHVRRQ